MVEVELHDIFLLAFTIAVVIVLVLVGLCFMLRRKKKRVFGICSFRPTPRENDVLELILEGCTNKLIGYKLGISEQTIKNYVSNLLRKTETESKLDLVCKYFKGEIKVDK